MSEEKINLCLADIIQLKTAGIITNDEVWDFIDQLKSNKKKIRSKENE